MQFIFTYLIAFSSRIFESYHRVVFVKSITRPEIEKGKKGTREEGKGARKGKERGREGSKEGKGARERKESWKGEFQTPFRDIN